MNKFKDLLIATHNKGKVREIADLLAPYVTGEFYSAIELGLPEPEETGSTFAENALLKARAAALGSGKISLADDSGLCVNALGGEPGIYSARWAEKPDGSGRDFRYGMKKLHDALGDHEDRSAYFVCVLALVWPDDGSANAAREEVFEGRVNGSIVWPMRGEKGFGYDPVFVADGYDISFAQMDPVKKHAISHRADAFDKLVKHCFKTTG